MVRARSGALTRPLPGVCCPMAIRERDGLTREYPIIAVDSRAACVVCARYDRTYVRASGFVAGGDHAGQSCRRAARLLAAVRRWPRCPVTNCWSWWPHWRPTRGSGQRSTHAVVAEVEARGRRGRAGMFVDGGVAVRAAADRPAGGRRAGAAGGGAGTATGDVRAAVCRRGSRRSRRRWPRERSATGTRH